MADYLLLHENYAEAGLFGSSPAWLSSLPLQNMQDRDPQIVARSNGATAAATFFTIDLGAPKAVNGVMFGPANLSPAATWRVRAYSNPGFSVLVYDSGTQTITGSVINWASSAAWLEWEDPGFWIGISDFTSLNEVPQYNWHIVSNGTTTAQYWKFEFFDTGNVDGAVQIGYLMIAAAFRPSVNYSEVNNLALIPLTDMEESLGGKRAFFVRGRPRRAYRVEFPMLDESEVFGSVMSLGLRAGTDRPVFVVPDPDDETTGTRRSFLATLKQPPAIQQLLVSRGSTAIELEELV